MNGAIVAKFFYSHRDGELEGNHKSMLQCLLYEILEKDESFFMHFQQEYRNLSGPKAWEYRKLKGILRACLKHPLERSIFLVIDAMDESDDCDREDIVHFLRDLSMPTNKGCIVKVFLASRPINETHHVSIPVRQRIMLQEKSGGDIERYTRRLLERPVFSYYKDEIKDEIKNYIVEHADGVFLWVCMVGDALEDYCRRGGPPSRMLKSLEPLPEQLEGYYEYMLQGLGSGDGDDARDGTRILQFCLFSHRPIELLELRDALAIPGEIPPQPAPLSWEDGKLEDIRPMLAQCTRSFVEVKCVSGKLLRSNGLPNGKIFCLLAWTNQILKWTNKQLPKSCIRQCANFSYIHTGP